MSTATMTTSGTNMSSTNLSALNKKPVQMKVRLHYLEDTFLLIVPVNVSYAMLLERDAKLGYMETNACASAD